MLQYTSKQYNVFCTFFGAYIIYHFYNLIGYADELFGVNGVIPDPSALPTWKIFRLISFGDKIDPTNGLILLTFVSILFTIGVCRRLCALVMWYGWMYLLNRNVFISNPGIPYVGWLLLVCAVIPSPKNGKEWNMPELLYWGSWFLMASGYTISGLHKLECASWIDGTALNHVLSSVLAYDNFLKIGLLEAHPLVLQIHTWVSLFLEITFLPLGTFRHLRKWYWLAFMTMHIGILFLVNFMELTLGVLMIHMFTFDSTWLEEYPFKLFSRNNFIKKVS
jgi:hypothetical protein